jgi:two-component sensor histidine kinase
MALIHEILYDSGDLSSIDLGTYMTRLTANLARMYRSAAGLVKIEVNSEDVMLGIDVMVPCGLAISEIVSNSLKYAFPEGRSGRIEIRASSTADGGVEIVVQDDGVGISPDVDIRSTGTMGMSLVLGLIEKQLGGSIELDRDAGTTFTILIPGDAEAV